MNRFNNFNSIKVRLEPLQKYKEIQNSKFQFHKGTIRTLFKSDVSDFPLPFQFHKGTIRTVRQQYTNECISFQFHKGTIRTLGKPTVPLRRAISIP